MVVFLGADHRGFDLKKKIMLYLSKRNCPIEDVGNTIYDKNDDYPKYAALAVQKIIGSSDEFPMAILCCGGGQGMAMAANRYNGIRAAVVNSVDGAKWARNDNNANVLSLPAELFDNNDDWQKIIDTFITTKASKSKRHKRRIKQLDELA